MAEHAEWLAQQRRERPEIPMPVVTAGPMVASVVRDNGAADVEEEGVATSTRSQITDTEYNTPFDEDGPVWPDEVAEANFLAEQSPASSQPAKPAKKDASRKLPAVQDLTSRLDPAVLEQLEELFRAKFVAVRQVEPGWLKDTV